MQAAVKIGPKFFRNELREYGDWRWAYVREALQNCMDAPRTGRIEINIDRKDENTRITFQNDGTPMTREILVDKLLSLGETGKNFEGSVGGFGKAKVLLYYAQDSYIIRTGSLRVEGSGGSYDLTEVEEFPGTFSEVVIPGDESDKLIRAVKKFASYAQWDGEIVLNGEKLECKLRKGSPRREFEWGTVYTSKAMSNIVIVRVNGIPMFSTWTEFDRTVVIELKGASVNTLTSNRDGLVWKYRNEFDQFLNDLITNKSRALKADKPSYTHFGGAKFKASKENPERSTTKASARDLVGANERVGMSARENLAAQVAAFATGGKGGTVLDPSRIGVLEQMVGHPLDRSDLQELVEGVQETVPLSVISEEFILKNETRLAIPEYYHPSLPAFGAYGKKLARVWGRLVLELHRMLKLETEFGIGFVFSEDAEAQYEKTGEFGTVYYLNPAEIVEQKSSGSKSFKKRFKLTERDRLLAIAVHEVVHGLGYSSHNEDYANKLTDVFGQVMRERKRFNWAFA